MNEDKSLSIELEYKELLEERARINREIFQMEVKRERIHKEAGLNLHEKFQGIRKELFEEKRKLSSKQIEANIEFFGLEELLEKCSSHAQDQARVHLENKSISKLKPVSSEESRAAFLSLDDSQRNPISCDLLDS